MARKVKGGKVKGGSKRSATSKPRAARPRGKARRLPSGSYSWKGRAVAFGKLPKAEQARIRSTWSAKARKTVRAAQIPKRAKAAREWVKRRTEWVPKHGKPEQYADMVGPEVITAKFSTRQIEKARKLQKAAHAAWVDQGKPRGGSTDGFAVISETLDALGPQLARAMPQLWWYH